MQMLQRGIHFSGATVIAKMSAALKVLFVLIALCEYPLSAESFLNRILGRFCDHNEIFVMGRICKHECGTIMQECDAEFAMGCHCKPDHFRNGNDECVHVNKCLRRARVQSDHDDEDELQLLPPLGDGSLAIVYSRGKLIIQGKPHENNISNHQNDTNECEPNEILAMHNACPKLCAELRTPSICRLVVAPSCSCKSGYLYNNKGVCVRKEECHRGIPGKEVKRRKKNK